MRYMLILLALGLLALPVFATDANSSDNATATDIAANSSGGLNLTDTAGLLATCSGNESASVGALPGDFTYGFKRFFENVDKFFTFDKSDSALKHAKYGKMRAVEAHLMACRAHDQEAAGNVSQANSTISTVQELVDEQNKENEQAQADLEAAVASGTASNSTVAQVDNDTRNSIEVLQRVYERAPEAAKDGLLNALNNSIANYEKHQEKMKEHGKGDRNGNETSENETSGNGTSDDGNSTGHGKGRGDDGNWNGTSNLTHGDDGNESDRGEDGNRTHGEGFWGNATWNGTGHDENESHGGDGLPGTNATVNATVHEGGDDVGVNASVGDGRGRDGGHGDD